MNLRQTLNGTAKRLFEYSQTVPVIDTHEHVPLSEQAYNNTTMRFGQIFEPYITKSLRSAGMTFSKPGPAGFREMKEDWDALEPYWLATRHGSYTRPFRLALQKFYGVDDLTRENWRDVMEQINANNTPGIYKRVFHDACGIEKAIVCAPNLPAKDDPIFKGNITSPSLRATSKQGIEDIAQDVGAPTVASLGELLEAAASWMEKQVKENGAIQFKTTTWPIEHPDREKAQAALNKILAEEELEYEEERELAVFLREADAKNAGELGVPLAIHTGVWNDFRQLDARHLIKFIFRNSGTKMDLYHVGIPNVRETLQIVKNFPNAYLNLCWAHIVASDMVVQTLKEAIDMVPLNKIFAFGADYIHFVEKVYGHLHMARENIAIVLGDRVQRNLMDLDEAKHILRAWFYDNPKKFYGL